MIQQAEKTEYVLLPPVGLRPPGGAAGSTSRRFLRAIRRRPGVGRPRDGLVAAAPSLEILDSIATDGAKLVALAPDEVPVFMAQLGGLRLVPVFWYQTAEALRFRIHSAAVANPLATTGVDWTLRVRSKIDGTPIANAEAHAFTDVRSATGVAGVTDTLGRVTLTLPAGTTHVERLYVYPKAGFWSLRRSRARVAPVGQIRLEPIGASYIDVARHFYGWSDGADGSGVRVGIVDTGIDLAHADLSVEGGENTVTGEPLGEFGDNGSGHGTHVAGIAAGSFRGLAPGVALRSYRAFPSGSQRTRNFAIAKSIDAAIRDGCDLINVSATCGINSDPTVDAAVESASDAGALVVAAVGNDIRGSVGQPAGHPLAMGVSAMGRRGTFPRRTAHSDGVGRPRGKDAQDFVATFTNVGAGVTLVAPGVAIISTVPGGYLAMDGTSMACPLVTGVAAKLLGSRPDILGMARDRARTDTIRDLLVNTAIPLGFGTRYEGQGLPRSV